MQLIHRSEVTEWHVFRNGLRDGCTLPVEGMGVGAGSHEARMLGIPGDVAGDAERAIVALRHRTACRSATLTAHARSDPAKNDGNSSRLDVWHEGSSSCA
jgi:hypothetical protein